MYIVCICAEWYPKADFLVVFCTSKTFPNKITTIWEFPTGGNWSQWIWPRHLAKMHHRKKQPSHVYSIDSSYPILDWTTLILNSHNPLYNITYPHAPCMVHLPTWMAQIDVIHVGKHFVRPMEHLGQGQLSTTPGLNCSPRATNDKPGRKKRSGEDGCCLLESKTYSHHSLVGGWTTHLKKY